MIPYKFRLLNININISCDVVLFDKSKSVKIQLCKNFRKDMQFDKRQYEICNSLHFLLCACVRDENNITTHTWERQTKKHNFTTLRKHLLLGYLIVVKQPTINYLKYNPGSINHNKIFGTG